jgi:hypothetical protein
VANPGHLKNEFSAGQAFSGGHRFRIQNLQIAISIFGHLKGDATSGGQIAANGKSGHLTV